ncbi:MAG: lipopolysaccharide transport periplasmic protein LptA [Nevskiales bacterium]
MTAVLAGAPAQAAPRAEPINIEADQADLSEALSTYSGNVRVVQGGVTLRGSKLTVRKLAQRSARGEDQFQLTLSGGPATIVQEPDGEGQPIRGEASRIDYMSTSEILELRGNAVINRGGEEITGDNIQYDWAARRTLVNNRAGGGRVSITLTPGKRSDPTDE